MVEKERKWKFYPGCSITEGFGVDYAISNFSVMEELGEKIEMLEDWNCCGAVYLTDFTGGHKASVGLGALNIAKATKEEADLYIACSECYRKLLRSRYNLLTDNDLLEEIKDFLAEDNMELNLDTKIRHLLDYYRDEIGLGRLKSIIKFPLKGLKVYPYIGCLYSRPRRYHTKYSKNRDPEKPTELNELLEVLGVEVTHSNYLTECCGASCVLTRDEMADDMLNEIFNDAEAFKADAIITVCPMCKFNLDSRQDRLKLKRKIPILQFTQLIGLALEIPPKKLGITGNMTTVQPLLNKINKIRRLHEEDRSEVMEVFFSNK
jgi:heterodisulfide reductase subunit B